VSPILVRPVREQFEHDRIIRLLQARYKRKFDVTINPGSEQNASVTSGELAVYPDLLLFSQERGRRLQGTIEVETGESVNTLEAMAEWGPFSRLRAPFFLYIPPNSLDTARRLCAEHQVDVSEIWTYHTATDQVRFTMVHRAPESQLQAKLKSAVKVDKPEKKPERKLKKKLEKKAAPPAKAIKKAAARRPAPAKKSAAKKTTVKKAASKGSKKAKRR
jgi:hypothetical protein